MIKGIFDSTLSVLSKSLDLRADRHRLLSSNIANQETPGYRAKDINFEEELNKRIGVRNASTVSPASTNPGHIPVISRYQGSEAEIIERPSDDGGYDKNSVGIEGEMVRMTENTIMYNATTKMLKSKLNLLMTAIKEGGR